MITDLLDNLHKYSVLYPSITELIGFIKEYDLNSISAKTTLSRISLIPITSIENENFDKTLLEAHQSQIDIHITLEGEDCIAYHPVNSSELLISKKYDHDNDYLLAHSSINQVLTVHKGYFCIIPNNFAHMALYNNKSGTKKIVVKIPA